jgi:hypothetical protein
MELESDKVDNGVYKVITTFEEMFRDINETLSTVC